MKRFYNIIILFSLALSFLPLLSCNGDETESDYYNFQIIATGGDFTGYYSVDGEANKYITNDLTTDNDPYYEYSQNLDNPTSVRIHADGKEDETTYIGIEIYENYVLVESAEMEKIDTADAISVTCTYTFNTGDDEDE